MRPQALWLTSEFPAEPISGGQRHSVGLLAALGKYRDVRVLGFWEGPDEPVPASGLGLQPGRCRFVRHRIHLGRHVPSLARAVWRSLTRGLPYVSAKFCSRRMAARLALAAGEGPYDVAFVDRLSMACYAPLMRRLLGGTPQVLIEHNLEHEIVDRYRRLGRSRVGRLACLFEKRRLQGFERAACAAADAVGVICERDARTVRALAGRGTSTVRVLPPAFEPDPVASPGDEGSLLFAGGLGWPPNRDGLTWLLDEVLPRLRASGVRNELRVVGAGRLPGQDAYVAGGVDFVGPVRDLRAEYARSSIALVPIFVGGGVSIKTLEALSMGVPVVTTSAGRRGLSVRDGAEVMMADEAGGFARAVCEVLRLPELRRKLSAAGLDYVRTNHAPEILEDAMAGLLREVSGGKRPAGPGR